MTEKKLINRFYQIKNNLGMTQSDPIYFTIDETGIHYDYDCEVNITPLFENQSDKAKRIIINAISSSEEPVPANDMEELRKEGGVSESTWKRAKESLPVISFKKEDKWFWKSIE